MGTFRIVPSLRCAIRRLPLSNLRAGGGTGVTTQLCLAGMEKAVDRDRNSFNFNRCSVQQIGFVAVFGHVATGQRSRSILGPESVWAWLTLPLFSDGDCDNNRCPDLAPSQSFWQLASSVCESALSPRTRAEWDPIRDHPALVLEGWTGGRRAAREREHVSFFIEIADSQSFE